MRDDLQWLAAEDGACERRVMLVYAHADDEAIAVGGRLPLFANAMFVQVTDGAPADEVDSRRLGLSRDEYRLAREQEVCAAMRAGGLPAARRTRLGVTDKETAWRLPELAESVRALMEQERPEYVLTHAFEGGHADHDACAWAVRAAAERCAWSPVVLESPFYHEGDAGQLVSGTFAAGEGEELLCGLSEGARGRKRAMFGAHRTQAEVLRGFGVGEERFRVAPRYDFGVPVARAWYERFIEGMTAERFAGLACVAERKLRAGAAA